MTYAEGPFRWIFFLLLVAGDVKFLFFSLFIRLAPGLVAFPAGVVGGEFGCPLFLEGRFCGISLRLPLSRRSLSVCLEFLFGPGWIGSPLA